MEADKFKIKQWKLQLAKINTRGSITNVKRGLRKDKKKSQETQFARSQKHLSATHQIKQVKNRT